MAKPTLQKVYEKIQMIKKFPDGLTLMVAKERTRDNTAGEYCTVLCLEENNGDITPLAILLDQRRIDNLEPEWNESVNIQDIIKGAEAIEDRTTVADFNNQYPKIDDYFEAADF